MREQQSLNRLSPTLPPVRFHALPLDPAASDLPYDTRMTVVLGDARAGRSEGSPTSAIVLRDLRTGSTAILPGPNTMLICLPEDDEHATVATCRGVASDDSEGSSGQPACSDHRRPRAPRLAPWQERKAKQMLEQEKTVPLSLVAIACRVSVSHFGRAFRASTGVTPYQWQLGRRLHRAQELMKCTDLSLAEIAHACGFASQSHFTDAFRRRFSASPGRWRLETRSPRSD